MKAIIYDGFGDSSVIKWKDVTSPVLSDGQVRIKVKASGINRADLSQRRGHYPPPAGESDIPGLEVAGVILETTPSAQRFKKGDHVMALLSGGGYAEEVTVSEKLVLPIPQDFSFQEAAGVMETFITAHHNLFYLGNAKMGEKILLHAGASGVGTSGIQLLKDLAEVYVTVGTQEKADFCEGLGAKAILYKETNFAEQIDQMTHGLGVNVILDPVGASHAEKNLGALALGGRWIVIGLMGGKEAKIDFGTLMQKRARLMGSTLRALPLTEKAAAVERFEKTCLTLFSDGKLKPILDRVYPAADAAQAQKRMEQNENVGKIILVWE